MSGKRILRHPEGRIDWKRINALSDQDIERAIRDDPDAAPILDEAWFTEAEWVKPDPKMAISIRLDRDVLEWFKAEGPGYQSRMNAVLSAYMRAKRKAG